MLVLARSDIRHSESTSEWRNEWNCGAAGEAMVSESTSWLVENVAVLAEPELVKIKGGDVLEARAAQRARTVADAALAGRRSWPLVGRQWEMRALNGMLDESIGGQGCVVGVIGAPGIGKAPRLARELATIATNSARKCIPRSAKRMQLRYHFTPLGEWYVRCSG